MYSYISMKDPLLSKDQSRCMIKLSDATLQEIKSEYGEPCERCGHYDPNNIPPDHFFENGNVYRVIEIKKNHILIDDFGDPLGSLEQ